MNATALAPSRATVAVEKTTHHDTYTGTLPALLAAGVIEQRHLVSQPGKRIGSTGFMPDGSPVPAGVATPTNIPGTMTIKVKRDGTCEVRKAVALEVRHARVSAQSTLWLNAEDRQSYCGSHESLVRDGIAPEWLAGLPAPGKVRGRRVIQDGERRIEVSVGPAVTRVNVTHLQYYRRVWDTRTYIKKRSEWGLPPVPLVTRGCLSLVWSAA